MWHVGKMNRYLHPVENNILYFLGTHCCKILPIESVCKLFLHPIVMHVTFQILLNNSIHLCESLLVGTVQVTAETGDLPSDIGGHEQRNRSFRPFKTEC